ncbi:cytochrome B561 [Marichromatium purpuratum 984]|uniref:Cytochrome B561 n=1 Tax=Marichromatium purpuratum 984 TaxID=765910 RepID=W0E5Y5_MARPU|nr:cytochrome b/b6 domain-containing protein [Marichromatium purpuratum]AHF04619.1 cytochrome B561 [Marichromatium purpuratum 984]
MQAYRIRLWDLPTRVVHWLLFALVVAAYVTGEIGGNLMTWHGWIGLAIAGLIAFRITWGLVGSTYARFGQFVRGPRAVLDYLRGRWHGVGHNPIGAVSVLVLLGILAIQTLTGLFGNDDIAFEGPLYPLVSKDVSDWLIGLHRQAYWLIIALVSLHVAAMLFYALVRKNNLVIPMINGVKEVDDPAIPSARGGGPIALVFALLVAALVVWIAAGGLLPAPPPPPPPGSIPAW